MSGRFVTACSYAIMSKDKSEQQCTNKQPITFVRSLGSLTPIMGTMMVSILGYLEVACPLLRR